jgi:hypothetical protein
MGITSSIYALTCEQANNDTECYSKNKVDMRIVYDTPLQILCSVQDQRDNKTTIESTKGYVYPIQTPPWAL